MRSFESAGKNCGFQSSGYSYASPEIDSRGVLLCADGGQKSAGFFQRKSLMSNSQANNFATLLL